MPGLPFADIVQLGAFYGAYAWFLAAPALVWWMVRARGIGRVLPAMLLASISTLAYARFVEPRLLVVAETDIALNRCMAEAGSARIALVSDMHIGVFANAIQPARIAAAIARTKPDAALIAGDFTQGLDPARFDEAFGALARVGAPVYAVLGNHDVGLPGDDIATELTAALARAGVSVIDNQRTEIFARGGRLELVGLPDLWQDRQDLSLLGSKAARPRLVLTHNPLTAFLLTGRWKRGDNPLASDPPRRASLARRTLSTAPPQLHADLLLAGHTHGGQVRIPPFTCALNAVSCRPFRAGLGAIDALPVFITTGTGMSILPMRFLVPPRIDILNVR